MRLWALIGIIALLILPFSIVRTTTSFLGEDTTTTNSFGFFWLSTDTELFGRQYEDSEVFNLDWLDDNGVYQSGSYFGELWYLGLVLVIVLIVGAVLAVTADRNNNKSVPAIILLISGILLLILRLVELSDNDTSFYDSTEILGIEFTYLEIPLGFIIALIFSLLDFRSD
jgi:hypothetical protein